IERGGGYVVIGANGRGYLEAILLAPFVGLATGRKMGLLMWRVNDTADMADLAEMLADGRVRPHIDSTFSLDEVPRALARVQAGDFVGKIAIAI
ncbi:MAG: zinc-binding dehydrogenase, partial [Candidatus Limnocylindrales bacterium]